MKIVRFSQNGHAPRLGCFLGSDRIADLEASAAAFLASRGRGARAGHRGGALSARQHARLPRGRQREPGHADRHDGRGARRQVPAGGPRRWPRCGCTRRSRTRGSSSASASTTRTTRRRRTTRRPSSRRCSPSGPTRIQDPGEPVLRPRGREDARLGGRAGRGDRAHRALREEGAGPRLRLRLHHHQRRERARLPVPHHPVGRGQGGRHPRPGRPLHRGSHRDPGSPRARSQGLGQRPAHAGRLHAQLHLRHRLHHRVPHQHHDALAGRPHRHRHPRRAWASRASRRSRCSRATA